MGNENKRVFYLRGDVLNIEQDNDLPPVFMNQSLMGLMHKTAFPSINVSTELDYFGVDGEWEPASDQLWKITVEKVVEQ